MRFFSGFALNLMCAVVVPVVSEKIKPPEICNKRADVGSCEARYPAWYFDSKHQFCKLFFYSGCGGNSNRFTTELKCQETCLPSKKPEKLCSLLPNPVRCVSISGFWAFDPRENTCHHYSRGYCAGNANKFGSCVKCMKRCSIIQAKEACRLIEQYMEQQKKQPPTRHQPHAA